MTKTRPERSVLGAMYAGLALTVIATIAPLVDRATGNVLAGHIQSGYPGYTQEQIDTAVLTYLVSLSIIGVLGIMCWFFAIQAVRKRRRWARSAATLVLVVGASVGLFGLLVRDTSGDTGLPASLGWLGMLPSLAGVVAVSLLWRARPTPPVAWNA